MNIRRLGSELRRRAWRHRPLRRCWIALSVLPPLFVAAMSPRGLPDPAGRLLLWGKLRRTALTAIPAVALRLRRHHGLTGHCRQCGASCKILFQCPHWDDASGLCSVYEDRPNPCRMFPVTPADLRDRDLAGGSAPCGFAFTEPVPGGLVVIRLAAQEQPAADAPVD